MVSKGIADDAVGSASDGVICFLSLDAHDDKMACAAMKKGHGILYPQDCKVLA
jgi:hypothetical protein